MEAIEQTKFIRTRYRIQFWSGFFVFLFVIGSAPFLLIKYEAAVAVSFWLLIIAVCSIPRLRFHASKCPSCNKRIGFGLGKFTDYPKRCPHCGLSFLSEKGKLLWE